MCHSPVYPSAQPSTLLLSSDVAPLLINAIDAPRHDVWRGQSRKRDDTRPLTMLEVQVGSRYDPAFALTTTASMVSLLAHSACCGHERQACGLVEPVFPMVSLLGPTVRHERQAVEPRRSWNSFAAHGEQGVRP